MWWILEKDGEYKIEFVNEGNDPLYGNGSWNLGSCHGFSTYELAEQYCSIVLQ